MGPSPISRSAALCICALLVRSIPSFGIKRSKNERSHVPDFVLVTPAVCDMAVRNIIAFGSMLRPACRIGMEYDSAFL